MDLSDQLKNLSNLNYLKIKGQKIVDMTSLTFLDVSENHIDLSNSGSKDLQPLRQKRSLCTNWPSDSSSVQNLASEKAKRIEANTNDPKENFIYAFELFVIEEDDFNIAV